MTRALAPWSPLALATALAEVPYGKTATYLDLAKSLGNGKAARAVQTAF